MLTHLADVSIRSLLLIALAAIALLAARKYRSPALQHAIWTAVLLGTLALFAIGEILPRLPLPVLNPTPSQNIAIETTAANESSIPFEKREPTPAPTKAPRSNTDFAALATGLYALVAAAFAIRFLLGMLLVRRLLAQSTPLENFRESALIGIPVTAGWLRPVVVLPKEWREWDRQKLEAVLTHERAHVRRKDNLIAALAALNRCLLWFNPLAWWLERRLALLAEQACDEASILALGGSEDDREDYVRLLLDMAATLNTSHGRLRTHVLAMASLSQIRQRVEPLLQTHRKLSRGLTKAASAALAICCIPVVWATGSIDATRQATQLHLDVSRFTIAIPQIPEQRAQLLTQSTSPPASNPTQSAAPLAFEVASVKPHKLPAGMFSLGMATRGSPLTISGSRVTTTGTFLALMLEAYDLRNFQVSGTVTLANKSGDDALYEIDARAPGDGVVPLGQARQMLQSLLTNRFQLKFHRESKELPTYHLVTDGNTLGLKPSAPDAAMKTDALPTGRGMFHFQYTNVSLSELVLRIAPDFDRPLLDRTGRAGGYDFSLEYVHNVETSKWSPEEKAALEKAGPIEGPSLTSALQKLGLKVASAKDPVEVLVVDHVEEPSPN